MDDITKKSKKKVKQAPDNSQYDDTYHWSRAKDSKIKSNLPNLLGRV
uniref:Uncharacterized protein n=1 Tax=viral metagenome TaxID=1070528 RepID=A0A6M3IW29_9ZZZZ